MGGGWGYAFGLGWGRGAPCWGEQSTRLPEQLPAGTLLRRLLLLSVLAKLGLQRGLRGGREVCTVRDAVWALGRGAGGISAHFLPLQAVRAGGRSQAPKAETAGCPPARPRVNGAARMRVQRALPGKRLAGHSGRARSALRDRVALSVTLKAGEGHSGPDSDVRAGLWGAVPGSHLLPQHPGPAALRWELGAGMRRSSPFLAPLRHGSGARHPRALRSESQWAQPRGSVRRCPEVPRCESGAAARRRGAEPPGC